MKSKKRLRHESVVFGGTGLSAIETVRRAEAALRRADLHEQAAHAISTLPSREIKHLEPDKVPKEYLGHIIDKTNGVVYAHYIVASKDFGEDTIILRSGMLTRARKETDFGVKHLTGKEGYIELKQQGDMRAIGVRISVEGPDGLPLYIFKKYVTHSRISTLTIDRDKPIDSAQLMKLGSSAVSDVGSSTEYISARAGTSAPAAAAAAAASTASAGPVLASADTSGRCIHSVSPKVHAQFDSLIQVSEDIERLDKEGISYFNYKFENRLDGKSILATIATIHEHPAISSFALSSRTRLLKMTSILLEHYQERYLKTFLLALYDSLETKPALTGSLRDCINEREQELERHTIAQASALRALAKIRDEIREFASSESRARMGIFSEYKQHLNALREEISVSLAETKSAQLEAQLNRLKYGVRIKVAPDELQSLLQRAGVSAQEATKLRKFNSNPTSAFYKALSDQDKSLMDGMIYGGSNLQFFKLHLVSILRDVTIHYYLLDSMIRLGFSHYYDAKDIKKFLDYNIFLQLYFISNLCVVFALLMMFPYNAKRLIIAGFYNLLVGPNLKILLYFNNAISRVIGFMLPFVFHIVYEIGLQKYLGHQIDFAAPIRSSALHGFRIIAPIFIHNIALKVVPTYSHKPGMDSFFTYIILPTIVAVVSYKFIFVPTALSLGFLLGACIMRATSKHISSKITPVKSTPELDQVKPPSSAIATWNKSIINHTPEDGNTPLLLACQNGHVETANVLISARANLSQANKDGDTPLIVSARQNYVLTVNNLLNAGQGGLMNKYLIAFEASNHKDYAHF